LLTSSSWNCASKPKPATSQLSKLVVKDFCRREGWNGYGTERWPLTATDGYAVEPQGRSPTTRRDFGTLNGKPRRPTVTPEVAGSSPVAPVSKSPAKRQLVSYLLGRTPRAGQHKGSKRPHVPKRTARMCVVKAATDPFDDGTGPGSLSASASAAFAAWTTGSGHA
jgi:hypothetical protein